MDALGEQHAAAVTRAGAAPRLVVVALRPPVRNGRGRRNERAELWQQFPQFLRARPEAMLEDDAKLDSRSRLYESFRFFERDLERLLQQHMLARGGAALDQLEVRVRWREDEYCPDRSVCEDFFQPVALGETGKLLVEL